MQVCDITRSDAVVARYALVVVNGDNTVGEIQWEVDTGKQAQTALLDQNWQGLHALTPAALRKKDPSRSEAARKAGQTRAANRAAKAAEAAPAAPTGTSEGGAGTKAPTTDDEF